MNLLCDWCSNYVGDVRHIGNIDSYYGFCSWTCIKSYTANRLEKEKTDAVVGDDHHAGGSSDSTGTSGDPIVAGIVAKLYAEGA